MDNPGVFPLAIRDLSTALSGEAQTPIADLDGMTAVTLEFSLIYGSGGTSCFGVVQTSFDGGTTWRDIARADFTTAAAVKVCNLEGLLSKAVTVYAALNADTVNDGVLGDRLR